MVGAPDVQDSPTLTLHPGNGFEIVGLFRQFTCTTKSNKL